MPTLTGLFEVTVPAQDFVRPEYDVFDALSGGLMNNPEFKVLDSVVRPDSVSVMNVLGSDKGSTDVLRHNPTMFEDEITLSAHAVEYVFVLGVYGLQSKLDVPARTYPSARFSACSFVVPELVDAIEAVPVKPWTSNHVPKCGPRVKPFFATARTPKHGTGLTDTVSNILTTPNRLGFNYRRVFGTSHIWGSGHVPDNDMNLSNYQSGQKVERSL